MKLKPLTLTILAAYFHASMEWLFFVTTPSSLSTLTFLESLNVLFITGGVIAFLFILIFFIFSIPAKKWEWFAYIPAAFLLSVTALIMLDNFTYTVFKIGIVSTFGAWRMIYIVVWILLFYWMLRFTTRTTLWKSASTLSLSLFAASSALILMSYFWRDVPFNTFDPASAQSDSNRPNIIILGADGLNVSYLSAYGFEEDTTPFISELVKTSLVAENAFPNASSTTASTTSALTGKAPAEVSVYRYPDILSGNDSFQHLPAMLKDAGYYTVQIGTPSYVDARKVNLIDGFDMVNGQTIQQPVLDVLHSVLGNSAPTYFIELVTQRVTERFLHIFFVRDMDNPIRQVHNQTARYSDAERVDEIMRLLDETQEPLFIFSHFMNTHGPHFGSQDKAAEPESSADEAEWDVELYKEAIRTFDAHVEDIYQYLAESGKLENTVLVIYTDHGYRYVTNRRTPLIFHFPNGEHAGTRQNNAQVIDIPVTLLDYLNMPQPDWMTGASLLNDEALATREIISITAGSPRKIAPPFYQIKTVQIIVCHKWYALNVQENIWRTDDISGHTAPCDESLLPAEADMRQRILEYLRSYGYDVSSVE
jgi:arylsulfatase A-like enzyme